MVTPIVGLAFGLVTGALAALAPARSASSMSPAEAMRGEVTTVAGSRSPLERVLPFLSRLPVRWLMVVRGLTRSKRRSASTIIGVVLALTLVMVSWGMIDTMRSVIDRQFDEVALEDATAVIAGPVDDAAVGQVAAVSGVAAAEAVVALPAAVNAGDAGYSTELQAYEPDTAMHGFPDEFSAGGVVAGAPLAGELGVDVGDTVTVSLPTLDSSFDAVIDGFVDEPIGTYLYMGRAGLEAALASAHPAVDVDALTAPTVSTVKIQVVADADRSQVIDGIDELSTVAAVIDDRELVELVEDLLVFFYVFVGLMLVFGGTMAFALIFNTISVNVAERSGEYATMRANGIGNGRIARLIAGENLMLTSLGIGPGIIVGYLAGRWFMQQYSSDLFTLSFDMRPVSIAACAAAMLVVALLSLIPAIRVVRGLDIGLVVRERSL